MLVLGINADQADVSAVLLGDGKLLAAVEEERFTRVKHCTGFPAEAIRHCLAIAGVAARDVDHVAICGDPRANLTRQALLAVRRRPGWPRLLRRLQSAVRDQPFRRTLADTLGRSADSLPPIHRIEHHPAHLASAYYVSPFDSAAVCSADGAGDVVTTAIAVGEGDRLQVLDKQFLPHSLGTLYTAVSQFLGFTQHGDEYKVMGLAAFGRPTYVDRLQKLITLAPDGLYRLDRSFFIEWSESLAARDEGDRRPRIRRLWSSKLERLLGPPRPADQPLERRHEDIARSLQEVFEEAVIHFLHAVWRRTGKTRLCVAGGCFMNSVLNGKILTRTPFEDLFVQPAAGDSGTALGAALAAWCQQLGGKRDFVMEHAYTGTTYSPAAIEATLLARARDLSGCAIARHQSEEALCRATAELIVRGDVVGWYQGAMEWGSRALGSRSLLADPRRPEMRERINRKIKRRELFRPFAPSILESALDAFFVGARPDPFMVQVYPVRAEKREVVPAVVHVDGTGRPHTVSARANPRFFRLIRAFEDMTGVPMILNTSFNENEPIVESPAQALDCFLRTEMDALAIGEVLIRRPAPRDRSA